MARATKKKRPLERQLNKTAAINTQQEPGDRLHLRILLVSYVNMARVDISSHTHTSSSFSFRTSPIPTVINYVLQPENPNYYIVPVRNKIC